MSRVDYFPFFCSKSPLDVLETSKMVLCWESHVYQHLRTRKRKKNCRIDTGHIRNRLQYIKKQLKNTHAVIVFRHSKNIENGFMVKIACFKSVWMRLQSVKFWVVFDVFEAISNMPSSDSAVFFSLTRPQMLINMRFSTQNRFRRFKSI